MPEKKNSPATLLRTLLSRDDREGGPAAAVLPAWVDGPDWDEVERLLLRHGIAPYLYSRLAGEGRLDALPPAFRTRLKEIYRSSSLQHFALLAEFRRLAGAFAGRGIRAVPLKGAALFTTLYEEPGLRPMQDMDWLIEGGELAAAEEVMGDLGYAFPASLRVDVVRRTHFHLPLVSRNGLLRVELHWSLADEAVFPRERTKEVWRRVQSRPGWPTPRLDAVCEFLYLCLHAFKHGFLNSSLVRRKEYLPLVYDPLSGNRLIWFLDLWKLMQSSRGPGRKEVRSLAREWGLEEALLSSAALSQYVFGGVRGWDLPEGEVLSRPRGIKGHVHDRIAKGLLRESPSCIALAERLQRLDHRRDVRLVRGLDLLDLLTPAPGEIHRWRRRGGPVALPFLYTYRFLAGAGKAGLRAVRFLAGF